MISWKVNAHVHSSKTSAYKECQPHEVKLRTTGPLNAGTSGQVLTNLLHCLNFSYVCSEIELGKKNMHVPIWT